MASRGEKLAAQFILAVWNQWHPGKCGGFDIVEAYGLWDEDHWKAFQARPEKPFTP